MTYYLCRRIKKQQKLVRLIILVLCLLGEVLVLSAKADATGLMLNRGTEVFAESVCNFNDVDSCELPDTEEEEKKADVFYLKPGHAPEVFLCQRLECGSIREKRQTAHQLFVNLFANLPPPLS